MASRLTLKLVAVILASACSVPGAAQAELLRFRLQGTVTAVVDDTAALAGYGVQVGTAFSGMYTIDTSVQDARPDNPGFGLYPGALRTARYVVGGIVGEIPTPAFSSSRLEVHDRAEGAGFDWFGTIASIVTNAPEFGSIDYYFSLGDASGTAFSDDSIPSDFPALSAFEPVGPLSVLFMALNSQTQINMSIDHHVQVVPVPGAALCLCSALIGLVATRRRR